MKTQETMPLRSQQSLTFKLFTFIFGLVCLSCAGSQLPKACLLTPEHPPEIRGLKLGMPLSELKAKYHEASDYSGEIYPSDSLKNWAERPEFKGLNKIWYSTVFEKVSDIQIEYEETSDTSDEFKSQFFQKVQDTLNLNEGWIKPNSKEEKKYLSCGNYRIEVGLEPKINTFLNPGDVGWRVYKPYVKLEDVEIKAEAKRKFEAWKAEEENKKREGFRP